MTGPCNLIPVRPPCDRPHPSYHSEPSHPPPPVRPGDRGSGETLGLARLSPPLTSHPSPHTPSCRFLRARDGARCWGYRETELGPAPGLRACAVMRRPSQTEVEMGTSTGAQTRWQR